MGLRPGHCYSSTKDRPYTRHAVRVQKRDYIGAVPGLKTRQWNMGNGLKEFDTIVDLTVKTGKHGIQIRDNALESARLIINRALIRDIGKEDFFMKIRIFPHHILRENKQAQGAGADRVSKGMSHSYGKSIGRAARVRNGQKIVSVLVAAENAEKARNALLAVLSRLPCGVAANIHNDVESIGTKPKKIRDMRKEEEEEKEAEKEGEEKKEEGTEESKDEKKDDAKADSKEEKKEDKEEKEAKGDSKEEKKGKKK